MQLSYGTRTVTFQPVPGITWHVLPDHEPGEPVALQTDPIGIGVAELITHLEQAGATHGESLLLVVPDHTRRCRLETILPALLPALEDVLSLRIRILVANGSHVLQPEALVREMIGSEVYDCYPVAQHDCRDEQRLESLGTTSAGTPVSINRMAVEADWVVTLGGILFHYFAGFGGGPKMLLPGIAGYETIRLNHRRTLDPQTGQFHAECREGNIETNPVYLDLAEITRFMPRALSLQLVLSPDGKIAKAAAGPILPVQRQLVPLVSQFYSMPIAEKADVVIASAGGHPADVNLIQAHKSIHHAFQAVKPGGTVIVLAECSEGIGSTSFMGYFTGAPAAEMGAELLQNYLINGHTALSLKSKTEEARIVLISGLTPELVQRTGMIPAHSLEEAWDLVRQGIPHTATGYILTKAAKYLPVLA